MKKPRWKQLAAVAGTAALITLLASCGKTGGREGGQGHGQGRGRSPGEGRCRGQSGGVAAKEAESLALATEAYVYAYPLITMEMTRRVMTNVEKPEGTRAPMVSSSGHEPILMRHSGT